MTIRAHRLVAAGALSIAAVAAPIAIALTSAAQAGAAPCLAWYGNKDDGVCLSYSNGNGVNVGTPDLGIYGPNSGSMPGGGIGINTGPLLPGTSWNSQMPIG